MKVCKNCNVSKDLSQFNKSGILPSGRVRYKSWCKICIKERDRLYYIAKAKDNPSQKVIDYRKNYNLHSIGEEKYIELLSKYNGLCWICKEKEAVCIDHDHSCCNTKYSCGECVRGILCKPCNWSIGFLKESPKILTSAINYLQESKEGNKYVKVTNIN